MSNIDKLKSASAKAVDNFDPNMFVETRDVLALLDELEKMQAQSSKWCEAFHKAVSVGARYEERIAELEAMQGKPVMFIDGDISSADADKLAAVIREFKEETETPAARMARIIRENPHPTNMCDMPSAGTGKGE